MQRASSCHTGTPPTNNSRSTSFTNRNVYILSEKNEETRQDCVFTDYRHCLFVICPKMSYEAHKNYRDKVLNVKKKKGVSLNQGKLGKDGSGKKRKTGPTRQEKQRMEEKVFSEKKLNQKKRKRIKGEFVTYGSEVCLQHYESGMFITAVPLAAHFDKSAFKVQLTDELSDFMYFRISALQSYRQKEDKVFSDGDSHSPD